MYIVDATEVEKQDPLIFGAENPDFAVTMEFYSHIFGGAAAKLGVITALVATVVFMN